MNEFKYISIAVMIVGGLLSIVGILFHIQHWPDMFNGIVLGPVILLLGVILFIIRLIAIKMKK
jgi:hypothetical protein